MTAASQRPGMGAIPYAGGVTFRVWAPFASNVVVAGGFNGWNTTKLNAGSGLAVPFTSNFDGDFGTATVTCGTPGHLAVRLCPIADMSWKETDRAGALFSDRSGNGLSTTHDTLLPLGI